METLDDLKSFFDMSSEEDERIARDNYVEAQNKPENMSYWFPKISSSKTFTPFLKLPETVIVPISREWWKWLRSDRYEPNEIAAFNEYLLQRVKSFLAEKGTLFMKTGIFSNKFVFSNTVITKDDELGWKFLSIYYDSMVYGVDLTSEAVFREMIEDKENRSQIYEGMPMHTEFRVFYDFDAKEIVGVANYWHPELMVSNLLDDDLANYMREKEMIVAEFNQFKHQVANEVKTAMAGVSDISGRWSIDVMKNGDDFWLIDMARMELSALVMQMEPLGGSKGNDTVYYDKRIPSHHITRTCIGSDRR